jgi:hypothetical protein
MEKTFCPHGMPLLGCLQCTKNLAKAAVTVAQAARNAEFDITQIPAVMDKLNGVQGPRFMRRWFDSPAYELPMDFKTGRKDARTLDKAHLMQDLPFSWLENSTRVGPIVQAVVEELSEVNQFNGRVGRVKNVLDQLSPGMIVLMERLETLGLLDAKKKLLVNGSRFFGDLPAIELDYKSQFNRVDVGTSLMEKAFDALDDVYFALGSFSIKLAATQLRTYSNLNGFPAIEISELGLYVRDTYDFLNKRGEDQLLGYWNSTGVIKPTPAEYLLEPNRIFRWFKPYYKVTNDDYNEHRCLTGKGGDFMVFSTVKRVPVSILLHLGSIDFEEYLGRKDK